MPLPRTIELDGYDILDVLAESGTRTLLRVRPAGRAEPLIVKLLTTDHPTSEEIARLRHECAIAAGLPDEGFVRPLRVETFGPARPAACTRPRSSTAPTATPSA